MYTNNHLGSRIQTSAIRGSKPTIDRASKAARPYAATKPRSIAQAKQLGHLRQRSHDQLRTQSNSAIRGVIMGSLPAEQECVHYLSIVGSLPQMSELLGVHNQSWLLCREWPNCLSCAIDCDFVDADGRAALRARSIMGLLLRMAEVSLRDPRRLHADPGFACAIPGLLRKGSDPRFAQQNPRPPRMVRIRTLRRT